MPDLTVSANVDTLLASADNAAMRSNLGLTALATTSPGANVATALAVAVGSAGAIVTNGGALGTPSSGTATNLTGLPVSTGISGLGTGVATALAVNVGSAGAPVVLNGALGTPSSGTLTNATGLPISTGVSGLGTGVATLLATPSSANLASALTDKTGTGLNVFDTSPTLVTPVLGAATGTSIALTNSSNAGNTIVNASNLTSGTAAIATIAATANGGAITLQAFSSAYTTSGSAIAGYGRIRTGSGLSGLSLVTGTTAPISFWTNDIERMRLSSTGGLSLGTTTDPGSLNIAFDTTTGTKIGTATTQKIAFWNATPIVQPSGATQAAPAAYATGAFGLDSNANMQALYDLVVAMRTVLVNTGLMKGAA